MPSRAAERRRTESPPGRRRQPVPGQAPANPDSSSGRGSGAWKIDRGREPGLAVVRLSPGSGQFARGVRRLHRDRRVRDVRPELSDFGSSLAQLLMQLHVLAVQVQALVQGFE